VYRQACQSLMAADARWALFLPDQRSSRSEQGERILHRGTHGTEFKRHDALVGLGNHRVAEGAASPRKANDLTHRRHLLFSRCFQHRDGAKTLSPLLAFKSKSRKYDLTRPHLLSRKDTPSGRTCALAGSGRIRLPARLPKRSRLKASSIARLSLR
jgi:hypothetical protein